MTKCKTNVKEDSTTTSVGLTPAQVSDIGPSRGPVLTRFKSFYDLYREKKRKDADA